MEEKLLGVRLDPPSPWLTFANIKLRYQKIHRVHFFLIYSFNKELQLINYQHMTQDTLFILLDLSIM